jgi:hypothetical protein
LGCRYEKGLQFLGFVHFPHAVYVLGHISAAGYAVQLQKLKDDRYAIVRGASTVADRVEMTDERKAIIAVAVLKILLGARIAKKL